MKKLQRLRLVSFCIMLVVIMIFTGCGTVPATTPSNEPGSSGSPSPSSAPDNKDPFHIAIIGPMTGDNAQYGTQFVRGVETFIEEYNAAGGLDGRMFEVDIYDDKNDPKEAVNIANLIVSKDMYTAIIGPYASTNAFAMGDILDEAKLINISPCSSHPDYTKVLDYTIRIGHVNNKEGEFVAKYLKQKLNTETIAGVYINNDWGSAVNEAFTGYVKEMGMEMVVSESYVAGQTKDFSPILSKIKESNADSIYLMCNYAETGPILQQIKDLDIKANVIVGTPSYKVESLTLAGDAAEGALFITSFSVDSTNPKTVEFRKRIREKYDVEIDNFLVRAYDSMLVLTMGMENANGDYSPDRIRDEILKLKDVPGTSGTFSYMPDRNTTRTFMITKSNGQGSFEFVETPVLD